MSDAFERIAKRRKKRSRIIIIIVAIVMFAAGFFSGTVYKNNKIQPVTKVEQEKPESADIQPEKEAVVEEKTDSEEEKALKELVDSFDKMMNKRYPGIKFSVGIKNLDSGACVLHNNVKMNSASVIKLFILETVYTLVANDEYELTEKGEKELEEMITESSNKAANYFIEEFGDENEKRKIEETNLINKHIIDSGYKFTELNRKMHDTLPPGGPSGYQNYTCIEDVCNFLEGIYNKSLLEEPYNTHTLNLMKNQKRRVKIPAIISKDYPEIIVANKTGELSQVENDVALIMSDKFNLAFAVFTDNIALKEDGSANYSLKEDVQKSISEMGVMLVEMYNENDFKGE